MTQETYTENINEISVLDLLISVVESLRPLVVVPLLAGMLAYGASHYIAPTYESVSVQKADAQLAALYGVAQVRTEVVEQVEYKKPNESVRSAEDRLQKNLSVSFNNKNNTVVVKGLGDTPAQAQQIVLAAIESVAKLNQHRLEDVARLREQFSLATKREREYALAAQRVATKIAENAGADLAALVQSQSQLLNSAKEAQIASSSLAARLSQIQTFELLQPPTLPYKHSAPNRAVVATVTTLGVGFLLLLLVFVRAGVRNAEQSPELAEKLALLRRAWRRAIGR